MVKCVSLAVVLFALPVLVPGDEGEPSPVVPGKAWTVLHRTPSRATNRIARLPEKGPLFPVNDLELTGPRKKDPFLLSEFKSDAEWGADRSGLFVTKGKDAALLVAEAENFELEGNLHAEGLGGWFLLVGWKDGHGYMISSVKLKTEKSPWHFCEFRGGECVGDTFREVARHDWKGYQPFRLAVDKNLLDLRIGKDEVLKELELPNYKTGQVLIGTYNTNYGPRPLRIQSLRIRAK